MRRTQEQKKRALFDRRYVGTERRRAYRLGFILFWSILLTFFFHRNLVSMGIISERSMRPTLPEGSTFLINKYLYQFTRPQRGDIVVLKRFATEADQYVKRVIAVEGETLWIRAGDVYVNGLRLEEPYASGRTYPDLGPIRIGKGFCFVMGDNRTESLDSRHFGSIPLKNVVGKIKPGELFPLR